MAYDGRLLAGVTVLVAVVEAGSMTRAAEALGLTSSGVGRAVQRLEARVGVRLLDRTTRSLRLSEDGTRFYERVRPMLDGIEEAALDAAGSAQRVRGTLRVNVDPFFSRLVLAQELAAFIGAHRDLRVELVMRDNVGDLVTDGYDMAVRFGTPPMGKLIARKLLETRILTVASPAYLARAGRPAHPCDLAGHQCIDYRDPLSGRPFRWEFHRQEQVIRGGGTARLMVSDVDTMLGACVAGVGIAQIMALGSEHLFRAGHLVELFPDWPDEVFPLHAIYPSRKHRPAKVEAFSEFCRNLLGADGHR